MNGVIHPRAIELSRDYAASVEDCQLAIMRAGGDLELAEAIVRVYCMAGAWPDVERMTRNLSDEAWRQRESERATLLLPTEGTIVQ